MLHGELFGRGVLLYLVSYFGGWFLRFCGDWFYQDLGAISDLPLSLVDTPEKFQHNNIWEWEAEAHHLI